MNVYASTTLLWSKPIPEVLGEFAKLGLYGAEIWAEQMNWHGTSVLEIKRAQRGSPLAYTFHAPSWDLNQISINKAIREQSLGELERSFETAANLGASNVTVHPGRLSLDGGWLEWHQEQQIAVTETLIELAEQYGVLLSLELMEPKGKELITTPDEMNTLLEAVKGRFSVTFDVAHIPLHMDVVEAYLATKQISKVHLSDSSSSAYHLALGEGDIQLGPILALLEEVTIPVVLEGMDALSNRKLLCHLHYLEGVRQKQKEGLYEISGYQR